MVNNLIKEKISNIHTISPLYLCKFYYRYIKKPVLGDSIPSVSKTGYISDILDFHFYFCLFPLTAPEKTAKVLLLRQQKHDLIASGNELCHLFRRKRLIGKHRQIIKLLTEHIHMLSLGIVKNILH